jgi:hypothetical protein
VRHHNSIRITLEESNTSLLPYRFFNESLLPVNGVLRELTRDKLPSNNTENSIGTTTGEIITDALVFPERELERKLAILYPQWHQKKVSRVPGVDGDAKYIQGILTELSPFTKLDLQSSGAYILGSIIDSRLSIYKDLKEQLVRQSRNQQYSPRELLKLAVSFFDSMGKV